MNEAAIAAAVAGIYSAAQAMPERPLRPACSYCGTTDNPAGQNCRNCGAPPKLDRRFYRNGVPKVKTP